LLAQFVKRYLTDIEAAIQRVLEQRLNDEAEFGLMMRYALGWVDEQGKPHNTSTGKRLRPTVLLLCNEAAGGDYRKALPAAAAVELLHNFSLVHDDIQDNSATRHNRPTVWQVWGKANAINAGDAMFTLAYAALYEIADNVDPTLALRIWQIFNSTNLELTRGQHLDMRFEKLDTVKVDDYISMLRGKTAALLAACAQIGALIANATPTSAQHYHDFGLHIGIAFQIRDDILGIWGDPQVIGKSAATDIVSRKKSLPVLFGLDRSEELKALYQREAFNNADVREAVMLLDELNAQEYSREQELTYYNKAMKALDAANPQGDAADSLRKFVDALFERLY
jgi:geranylgeranyl diphosphate synthase, type I